MLLEREQRVASRRTRLRVGAGKLYPRIGCKNRGVVYYCFVFSNRMPLLKNKVLTGILVLVISLLGYANWPTSSLPSSQRVTRILVNKSHRTLTLMDGRAVIKVFTIALGRCPVGAKMQEGDLMTPEGEYSIVQLKYDSSFHRALKISYPTPTQKVLSQTKGVNPGSDIMIHGLRNGLGFIGRFHSAFDWTAGCMALTNSEIEQIIAVVKVGTPIVIEP